MSETIEINMTLEKKTNKLDIYLMFISFCMFIHLSYILLLIKSIFKGQAWRKPINVMILFNEGVKFACSICVAANAIIVLIWIEASGESGTSYMGNGSVCHIYFHMGVLGGLWTFLDGAG